MFSTQDPQLDADHDLTILHVEALTRRLRLGEAPTAVERTVLLEELAAHCLREEAVMAAEGYPGLPAHQEAHRILQASLHDLLARLGQPRPSLDPHLFRDTLLAHIVSWDEAFAAWRAGGGRH